VAAEIGIDRSPSGAPNGVTEPLVIEAFFSRESRKHLRYKNPQATLHPSYYTPRGYSTTSNLPGPLGHAEGSLVTATAIGLVDGHMLLE
jgi:hypothetical protein